uniref:Uncharacterized protein n=1 Tax=Arundo donax TaxID=35708 RepID=A0A0A9TTI5_ARUDO
MTKIGNCSIITYPLYQ